MVFKRYKEWRERKRREALTLKIKLALEEERNAQAWKAARDRSSIEGHIRIEYSAWNGPQVAVEKVLDEELNALRKDLVDIIRRARSQVVQAGLARYYGC